MKIKRQQKTFRLHPQVADLLEVLADKSAQSQADLITEMVLERARANEDPEVQKIFNRPLADYMEV